MWWTLNAFNFSVFLIKTIPSLVKQEWIYYSSLTFYHKMQWIHLHKFFIIKILLFQLKLYFISLLILIRFFLFTNAFLQYLQLINLTMVFFLEVFWSDFPILWHASISPFWRITSMSYIMEVTASSKSSSATSSGIPDITMLFLLPYCSTWFTDDSSETTLSSNLLHLNLNNEFSSYKCLIITSFIFKNSSFIDLTSTFKLEICSYMFSILSIASSNDNCFLLLVLWSWIIDILQVNKLNKNNYIFK